MKSNPRSRFFTEDKREMWLPGDDAWYKNTPFNLLAHQNTHDPQVFIHTTAATLVTTISTPWYPPRDFSILSVKLSVTGTPVSTDCVWDVLIDGASIFATAAERPRVKAGDLEGRKTYPSRQGLPEHSKLQCQGVTLSSATGPAVLTFELVPL